VLTQRGAVKGGPAEQLDLHPRWALEVSGGFPPVSGG